MSFSLNSLKGVLNRGLDRGAIRLLRGCLDYSSYDMDVLSKSPITAGYWAARFALRVWQSTYAARWSFGT